MTTKPYCTICSLHHRGRCELRATESQMARIATLEAEVNRREYEESMVSEYEILSREEYRQLDGHITKTQELYEALRLVKRNLAVRIQ